LFVCNVCVDLLAYVVNHKYVGMIICRQRSENS